MLLEDVPSCLCGNKNYRPNGGYFGFIASTFFVCNDCNRTVWALEDGKPLVILLDTDTNIHAGVSRENYINDVLLPSRENYPNTPIYPPCLPDNITAFQKDETGNWFKVDHKLSQSLPLPQNARKKKHDEFWQKIIAKLELTKPVKEIKNQYSDDKNNTSPWYELEYNKNTKIVFGDRKRVISLKVKHYEVSVPLHKDLEAITKEKNITFNRNVDNYSQEVEVHTWSEEDFVQYFKMVIEETNKHVR